VRFIIGLWIQANGVRAIPVGLILWFGCKYRLTEWEGQQCVGVSVGWSCWLVCDCRLIEWMGQLCGVVYDWVYNTDRRSECYSCVVKFVIGLWIPTAGVREELWGEVCDCFVNTDWRSERAAVGWGLWLFCEYWLTEWESSCGVMFVIVLWILTDGVREQLWGEVCDCFVNTDRRGEWDSCGVRFMITLRIQTDWVSGTAMGCFKIEFEYRLTKWEGRSGVRFVIVLWILTDGVREQLWGEVCDCFVNTDGRGEWDSCGVRFMITLRIQTDWVSGTAMGWVSRLSLNTDWRSERGRSGVRFVIGLWIQTDWVIGTAVLWGLSLGCLYRVTEWDSCGVRFIIALWILTKGMRGQLWGEFCDWVWIQTENLNTMIKCCLL
jgi:hypothetical protein